MKKASLAAGLVALLLLAACSSDSGDDGASEEAAAPEDPAATAVEETPAATTEAAPEAAEAPAETPAPELTPGPSVIDTTDSEQASQWQQTLATLGFAVTVDGDFGPGTEEATRQFQEAMDLPVSGVVDQATWDVANFLLIAENEEAAAPPEQAAADESAATDEPAAAPTEEAAPPPVEEAEPTPVPQTAEERDARLEEAKTRCTEQHGLIQAGPCVAEAMCFDVEPVGSATECRNTYWNLWKQDPGAA